MLLRFFLLLALTLCSSISYSKYYCQFSVARTPTDVGYTKEFTTYTESNIECLALASSYTLDRLNAYEFDFDDRTVEKPITIRDDLTCENYFIRFWDNPDFDRLNTGLYYENSILTFCMPRAEECASRFNLKINSHFYPDIDGDAVCADDCEFITSTSFVLSDSITYQYRATGNSCVGDIFEKEYAPVTEENLGEDNSCILAGNPIHIQTGNKVESEVDFSFGGLSPLSIKRTYNSQDPSLNDSMFGFKWNTLFDQEIRTRFEDNYLVVSRSDGASIKLLLNENGDYVPRSGKELSVSVRDDGFYLTKRNGDQEIYDSEGRITRLEFFGGGWVQIAYSSEDNLYIFPVDGLEDEDTTTNDAFTVDLVDDEENEITVYPAVIEDHLGNSIIFTKRAPRSSFRAIVNDTTVFTYAMTELNQLESVSVNSHTEPLLSYTYGANQGTFLLTSKSNGNGQVETTWTYDDQGLGTASIENSGETVTSFERNEDTYTVTNPLGKKTSYSFTTDPNDRLQLTTVEGHQSEHCAAANQYRTYDDRGMLLTVTDWEGRVTETIRDDQGRTTQKTVGLLWETEERLDFALQEETRRYHYEYLGNTEKFTLVRLEAFDNGGFNPVMQMRRAYNDRGLISVETEQSLDIWHLDYSPEMRTTTYSYT